MCGADAAPAGGSPLIRRPVSRSFWGMVKTIFELLSDYHKSLENMKSWLGDLPLDDVERVGLVDAWQEEMKDYFRRHGFCFACNKPLSRCSCEEPLYPASGTADDGINHS